MTTSRNDKSWLDVNLNRDQIESAQRDLVGLRSALFGFNKKTKVVNPIPREPKYQWMLDLETLLQEISVMGQVPLKDFLIPSQGGKGALEVNNKINVVQIQKVASATLAKFREYFGVSEKFRKELQTSVDRVTNLISFLEKLKNTIAIAEKEAARIKTSESAGSSLDSPSAKKKPGLKKSWLAVNNIDKEFLEAHARFTELRQLILSVTPPDKMAADTKRFQEQSDLFMKIQGWLAMPMDEFFRKPQTPTRPLTREDIDKLVVVDSVEIASSVNSVLSFIPDTLKKLKYTYQLSDSKIEEVLKKGMPLLVDLIAFAGKINSAYVFAKIEAMNQYNDDLDQAAQQEPLSATISRSDSSTSFVSSSESSSAISLPSRAQASPIVGSPDSVSAHSAQIQTYVEKAQRQEELMASLKLEKEELRAQLEAKNEGTQSIIADLKKTVASQKELTEEYKSEWQAARQREAQLTAEIKEMVEEQKQLATQLSGNNEAVLENGILKSEKERLTKRVNQLEAELKVSSSVRSSANPDALARLSGIAQTHKDAALHQAEQVRLLQGQMAQLNETIRDLNSQIQPLKHRVQSVQRWKYVLAGAGIFLGVVGVLAGAAAILSGIGVIPGIGLLAGSIGLIAGSTTAGVGAIALASGTGFLAYDEYQQRKAQQAATLARMMAPQQAYHYPPAPGPFSTYATLAKSGLSSSNPMPLTPPAPVVSDATIPSAPEPVEKVVTEEPSSSLRMSH